MFKGMQGFMNQLGQKENTVAGVSDYLIPIIKSDVLLLGENRKTILAEFPALLSLSDENFENLCVRLLHRYAEFVQNLPETNNSYYANKGGFLDHALHRTKIVLQLLQSYFLSAESENTSLSQAQSLWAYAIFSAAILFEIGRIASDFQVNIYDRNKHFIKQWSPFDGSLVAQGQFYNYEFTEDRMDDYKRHATLLLAQQIMPPDGFRWLASDKNVLAVWLALLDEDKKRSGHFGLLLSSADALAIKQYFEALKLAHQQSRYIQGKENLDIDFQAIASGLAFLDWLRKELNEGKLAIDRDGVYKVDAGVLITEEVFKRFADTYGKEQTAVTVRESFEKLQLHQVNAGGTSTQRFVQLSNNRRLSGLTVTHLDLLVTDPETLRVSPEAQKFLKQPDVLPTDNRYIAENGKLTGKVPVKPTASHTAR